MKSIAEKLDTTYSAKGDKPISTDTWAEVMAYIHKKRDGYKHTIGKTFVTIRVSKTGQISYMNMNKVR